MPPDRTLRVLHSFPQKLGADRVCYTAWQQVQGLHAAGARVLSYPGVLHRPVPTGVTVRPTLARGSARLPYRVLGLTRTCGVHDRIVARRLSSVADRIDLVHAWPLGARHTLRAARDLGIPTFLERANAHTRFAYSVVANESERLGVRLPKGSEHAFDARVLEIEEEEYELADWILCPSDFVVRTFVDAGVSPAKLLRHAYGFDQERFAPGERDPERPFTAAFVGTAAVRKGLHLALEAWVRSGAAGHGRFLVVGDVLPDYARAIADTLRHPSVHVLGHRDDVPEILRQCDVLVLPSLEEGFGLVCVEAMASGCVPLVSDACTDECRHGENALVHAVGDVAALAEHLRRAATDAALLEGLRSGGLLSSRTLTWAAAADRLLEAYATGLGPR